MTTESMDALAEVAETLDNLNGALQLSLPPQMHVDQLKAHLPALRDKLRQIYVTETGDDPWETSSTTKT